MIHSDHQTNDSKDISIHDQHPRFENDLACAIGINIMIAMGTLVSLNMAVSSIRWHHAESFAELALFFLGVHILIIQTLVFMPAVFFYAKKLTLTPFATKNQINFLTWAAILLPAMTLLVIFVGTVVTEFK